MGRCDCGTRLGTCGCPTREMPQHRRWLSRESLDREPRVALDDLLSQMGSLAGAPKLDAMNRAIDERATVRGIVAFEWSRNADELRLELSRRGAHGGVAVSAEVGEQEVR